MIVNTLRNALFTVTIASLLRSQEPIIFNESITPLFFETVAYPLTARLRRVQGTVVVRVRLDGDGKVLASAAISGTKSLISDCVENAKKWRFKPNAERAAIVIYRFKIEGLCNLPCPSQFRFEPPNLAIITIGDPVVDHADP